MVIHSKAKNCANTVFYDTLIRRPRVIPIPMESQRPDRTKRTLGQRPYREQPKSDGKKKTTENKSALKKQSKGNKKRAENKQHGLRSLRSLRKFGGLLIFRAFL